MEVPAGDSDSDSYDGFLVVKTVDRQRRVSDLVPKSVLFGSELIPN